MKHVLAAFLLGALAVLPGIPAQAQLTSRDAIALNDQIAELRHEIQGLRDQVAHGAAASSSSLGGYRSAPAASGSDITAQLLDRVSRLEDEVRDLRGRIDETSNASQRQSEDLAKQIGDLNFKVDGLTGGNTATPPAGQPTLAAPVPAPAPALAAPAPAARHTPEALMQEGNAALARRDYAAAEAAAREVLAQPRSPRSGDADFLLAQALAGKKDWARAAVAYDDSYNRAKTGAHAPDSLLGLAVALTNLNERKAACETLDKLRAGTPNPRQDLRAPIAAARQRAVCR
ncbi:MAG: tetratricopeptide repeat protein [Xanthobacteraceae bacterium]|nr:tetratricopeptide repeat protein [Xanthobacteraceae bacterium]